MNKLQLKQAPIIEYDFLVEEGKKVTEKLEKLKLNELVITEDTVKGIKKVRTELKKEFEEYDAARKAIKEMVMKPYEDFNKSFEEHIKSKYSNADSTLKLSIDEVENGIKKSKQEEVINEFNTLVKDTGYTFLKFEKLGIKLGLSDTITSLNKQVNEYFEKVKQDLETIETLENSDRVLAKYHQLVDLNTSIIQVNNDIKSEKEIENARIEREKVAQAVAKVEVIETPKEVIEVVEEELITLSFKVTGTKTQIIKVREYMKAEGIKYE